MSSDRRSAESDSSAASANTRQTTQAEASSSANVQMQNLREYTKARSTSSKDCAWLYELLSSDAISAGKVNPMYKVRVYYKEPRDASTTTTKDFGSEASALLGLKYCLALTNVCAVILCHRDSSRVDPRILDSYGRNLYSRCHLCAITSTTKNSK